MAAPAMVVVANPSAGHGKAGKVVGKVDQLLHAAGVEHEIVLSESAADLEARVRRAATDGASVVGCIGGDGTVGLAANGLLGTDATLAIFPSGTADDFAGSIGLKGLESAVRAVTAGNATRIDTGVVRTQERTRHYVAIASCGLIQASEGLTQDNPEAMARIIEGLITGMGFIGGGAILRLKDSVKGTATAASLWVTGAIGIAVGLGVYDVAIVLALVTIFTLRALSPLKQIAHPGEKPIGEEVDPKAD